MSNNPIDLGPSVGIFTDSHIKKALKKGHLFAEGTFNIENAKYASYELRVGDQYELVKYDEGEPTYKPLLADENRDIIIRSGETVRLTAIEVFNMPSNVVANITIVGQIFSAGLTAANTFADPGYTGPINIIMSNITNRALSIKTMNPLARVEFNKLDEPVRSTHQGYTGIRPNFIKILLEDDQRNCLVKKSNPELLKEMLSNSIDEALQNRFARTEVLIERAHSEILHLKALKQIVGILKNIIAVISAFFIFILLYYSGVLNDITTDGITTFVISIFSSMVGGYFILLLEDKVISSKVENTKIDD